MKYDAAAFRELADSDFRLSTKELRDALRSAVDEAEALRREYNHVMDELERARQQIADME